MFEAKRRCSLLYLALLLFLILININSNNVNKKIGLKLENMNVYNQKKIDEKLKSNEDDKYTSAKNIVLSEYEIFRSRFKNNEEWGKLLQENVDVLNEYISSYFNFVEAEIDKKSAEFDASAEGLGVEQGFNDLAQEELNLYPSN